MSLLQQVGMRTNVEKVGNGGAAPKGGPQGQIPKDALKLVASAGGHLHTPLEHGLGLVAPNPSTVTNSHASTSSSDLARGGGQARQPVPIRQAIFWALTQHLKQAIQGLGEDGLKEAKTSGWLNE